MEKPHYKKEKSRIKESKEEKWNRFTNNVKLDRMETKDYLCKGVLPWDSQKCTSATSGRCPGPIC